MRSSLILKNFLLALAITSQSHFSSANISNTTSIAMTETESAQILDHSLGVNISLRTPTDSTINFRLEGKFQESNVDTRTSKIPHLILKRNAVLTPGFERTLLMSVNHLSIPSSGLFLDLTIETQHGDPDLSQRKRNNIEIWHEIRFVPHSNDQVQSVDFAITFGQAAHAEGTAIQTPTDYYAYRLLLMNAHGEKLQEIHTDYA